MIDEVDTQDRMERNKGKKRIGWDEDITKQVQKPSGKAENSLEEDAVIKITVHRKPFGGRSILKKPAEDEIA